MTKIERYIGEELFSSEAIKKSLNDGYTVACAYGSPEYSSVRVYVTADEYDDISGSEQYEMAVIAGRPLD